MTTSVVDRKLEKEILAFTTKAKNEVVPAMENLGFHYVKPLGANYVTPVTPAQVRKNLEAAVAKLRLGIIDIESAIKAIDDNDETRKNNYALWLENVITHHQWHGLLQTTGVGRSWTSCSDEMRQIIIMVAQYIKICKKTELVDAMTKADLVCTTFSSMLLRYINNPKLHVKQPDMLNITLESVDIINKLASAVARINNDIQYSIHERKRQAEVAAKKEAKEAKKQKMNKE